MALPAGVTRRVLKTHPDDRGNFTEFFRNEWYASPLPVQWNITRNQPNVLRGVQVHARHWDYLCVIAGELCVGLHDVRPGAIGVRSAVVTLSGQQLEILVIPPGVAHGLYSPAHATHLIGVSSYYDPTDHARCSWNCPELELNWPCDEPELSASDREPLGYADFVAAYLAAAASVRHKA
ncbi:MAG TPA: dTDP-4-dehydrorhamnose 3,5-epimerase family protein [Dongiaceae bacterium]